MPEIHPDLAEVIRRANAPAHYKDDVLRSHAARQTTTVTDDRLTKVRAALAEGFNNRVAALSVNPSTPEGMQAVAALREEFEGHFAEIRDGLLSEDA